MLIIPGKTNDFPTLIGLFVPISLKWKYRRSGPCSGVSLPTPAADGGYLGQCRMIERGATARSGRDQCMRAVLAGGFNRERFIAKRARFLARRLGREAPQQG